MIIRVRDRHARQLVRGSAPAFSPDGHLIAFIATDHRLMIAAARGRHPAAHSIGTVRAVSVDWQPKPYGPNPGCPIPPGAKTLASSSAALVIGHAELSPPEQWWISPLLGYMGCLRADGRQRLLEKFTRNGPDSAYRVVSAVVAAPYAALVKEWENAHYGPESKTVQVFDLRTGSLQRNLGGESPVACPDPCRSSPPFGPVVLGSDGVSAADTQQVYPPGSFSTSISAVSCPATNMCVAGDSSGRLLTSVDPVGGAAAWSSAQLVPPATSFNSISCPSAALCVGVGPADILTSTDPTGGAGAWTSTPLPGSVGFKTSVSCPSPTLCVAAGGDGSVATSTNPTGGASSWSVAQIESGPNALFAVFCSARPECFVTDGSGKVFTSTQPTGGTGAWTASPRTPAFQSGSCPTTNLCVAVTGGQILTTTDPAAGPWKQTVVKAEVLNAITCPSASLCVAVGLNGALEISTDPASGVWAGATIDHGRELNSISCPSTSTCVAVDTTGHVVTSTDPIRGPSTWTPALIDGDSCNDTTPCTVEQILASAGHGVETIDSSKLPGNGPFLTGLKLAGDVLSWSHDGTPRSLRLR